MSMFGKIYTTVGEISRRLGIYKEINEYKNSILFNIYKNEISKNSLIREKEKRGKCFIITSGASINNYDLKQLNNNCIITNGTLYKHPDFRSLDVDYHYIGAPAFAIQKGHENGFYINQCIHNKKDLSRWLKRSPDGAAPLIHTPFCKKPSEYFFEMDSILSPDTIIIANVLSKKYIEHNGLYLDNEVYYFLRSQLAERDISVDYTKLLRLPDGGIHGCISLALYLGFQEIYILGNDYTFNPSLLLHDYDSPKFLKKIGKEEVFDYIEHFARVFKAEIFSITEDDDYYIPIFSRKNEKFDDEHWSMHNLMNAFSKENKANIYNVVPEGVGSSVYDQITWNELITNLQKEEIS